MVIWRLGLTQASFQDSKTAQASGKPAPKEAFKKRERIRGSRPPPTPRNNVNLLKRKAFLNDLNFPTCLAKLCQNEAQDHSFQGAKDEHCSYKSVLKRAVSIPRNLGGVGTPYPEPYIERAPGPTYGGDSDGPGGDSSEAGGWCCSCR